MSYIVRNDEGLYVTESSGACYFSPKQKCAKRFSSVLVAARIALRWGDDAWRILRLVKRESPCPLCEGTGRIEPSNGPPNPPSDDGGWNDTTRANYESRFGTIAAKVGPLETSVLASAEPRPSARPRHTCPPRLEERVSIDGAAPTMSRVPLFWSGCDACIVGMREAEARRASRPNEAKSEPADGKLARARILLRRAFDAPDIITMLAYVERVDAELREMGVDPVELGKRGLTFVEEVKAERDPWSKPHLECAGCGCWCPGTTRPEKWTEHSGRFLCFGCSPQQQRPSEASPRSEITLELIRAYQAAMRGEAPEVIRGRMGFPDVEIRRRVENHYPTACAVCLVSLVNGAFVCTDADACIARRRDEIAHRSDSAKTIVERDVKPGDRVYLTGTASGTYKGKRLIEIDGGMALGIEPEKVLLAEPRPETPSHDATVQACVAAAETAIERIRARRARTIGRNSQLLGEQESGALCVVRAVRALLTGSDDK